MISLLRRNRKQKAKSQQRPLTRSLIVDQRKMAEPVANLELYNDNSLDSLVFAASLGLASIHHPSQSPNDVLLLVQDQPNKQQQPQQQKQQTTKGQQQQQQQQGTMEFHCRFCGKGYRWKSTMRRHETLECGDKPPSFQCPECPYRARQRGNLTVHLKRHHQRV
ncbi:hypothetical protein TSAR_011824 [Trichomalopsis sarcophagae]|uniref:C2H2-type domain-containing protein n=1 Tax=Trichomalopsis sarcophagae TaxID=543379 RepID=A0A232F655_9HYME|nr:hypothetical protein TSAR_011824 [Trichomalopsis sarcophagae]